MPSIPGDPITFSCVLEARRETVYSLAKLIHERRERAGTRRGTRAPGPYRQAVLVLRWFLDATRVRQLAADNRIGKSTCYDRLHEAINLLAALAPDVHEAILAASAAGATHPNLDGTLIHADRVAMKGPNGADLWRSGEHKHHGGNIQVLSDATGLPIWVSGVRPGREHDTTCAKAEPGLLAAPAACESDARTPTPTDLGYLNLSPAVRHPFNKPKGGEPTEAQTTYNEVIRGARRGRTRERTAQGDLRGPAKGQPQPDTYRRDHQGRTRPTPPRTRPPPTRRLHEVTPRHPERFTQG